MSIAKAPDVRVLTDYDLHLFGEGTFLRAFEKLGAHRVTAGGMVGIHFAVWAPNAAQVNLIGDFNGWDGRMHPMRNLGPSGVWEIFIPGLADGEKYKYRDPHPKRRAVEEGGSLRRQL